MSVLVGRIRLHWFIGSFFISMFALLMMFRLDLIGKGEEEKNGSHLLPVEVREDRETWMNIYQEKQKIGYVHRQIFKTLEGYKILESVLMQLNTLGMTQDLRFKTIGNLNQDLTLSSFDFELFSSLFRFKARGSIRDRNLIVSMVSGTGPEQKLNIPLRKDVHLSVGLLEILKAKDLKLGDGRTFTVFDPITATERSIRILVVDEEDIDVMGREQKAKKVSVEFMGISQFAWIGKDGSALREEGPLGIRLEQVAKEEALRKVSLSPGTDIARFASIPSNRVIRSPETLTELRLTLTGIDEKLLSLSEDRQSFGGGVLVVRKEEVSNLHSQPSAQMPSEEMKKYLKATPFVQSDHPEIKAKVREIISPNDSQMEKARKLVEWVHKNLQKRPVLSVPNALEILRHRVGDCNEHAVLLMALAQAAGIPAQVEAGVVYHEKGFYYHAWNVLYVGRWVTADATMGQFPADVTHIRLIRGLERQIDLIRVIGRMKLRIEGYS